ncbi:site-specific tyrosine recombinase XerD [Nesterenkonia natronophila]|uniref:Tyrosine recombinase XerC n=1 Tax=Nesterenkonia natronophila TaxID=2174932 RepID=A0A3A4FGN6_9MICC|nr:site-specific tyrosine recombinase XerD [Nesterenkonia natronophila]RJN31465.1 site-specific tyrosine recombinase XerD [Nesterenkonia natronophila]
MSGREGQRGSFRKEATSSALWPEVADYLAHLRIERGSSTNTLASYERDLCRYAAYLSSRGVESPAAVDTGHVADYLQAVTTGADEGSLLAERSVARMLASVRGLHKYWAQEGRAGFDAANDVAAPTLAQSLPKALTVDQVTRLIDTPDAATPLGLRDQALLEFLYATGARIGEAVALDVDDVHSLQATGQEGLVLVRVTGKGNKQRMVPLGRMAQKALGDYLTAGRPALAETSPGRPRRNSPALFVNKLGGRLSRQSAWEMLRKTAQAAELSDVVSPHTLRHSCATHMLEAGADIRTVQELLGHASVTTTQIYTKVTAETLQETYLTAHPRAL